jgi:succinylglutamate desuccinylase
VTQVFEGSEVLSDARARYGDQSLPLQRELGSHGGEVDGPLLIVTAGIHGNEPAGLFAFKSVLERLRADSIRLRGKLVGYAGNLPALARDSRYVDEDLNRLWAPGDWNGVEFDVSTSERRERRDLAMRLERAIEHQRSCGQSVRLLDLHSTSGNGPPFVILEGGRENQAMARALGLPAILDLHKNIPGTLLDFVDARAVPGLVLEGGQNQAKGTRDHHEAGIWLLLQHLDMLPDGYSGFLAEQRELLACSVAGLPGILRIFLRWHIEEGEDFQMEPGFRGFQRIRRGELLARSRGPAPRGLREIRCPSDAVLIMPRYQGQGSDGFFLARDE